MSQTMTATVTERGSGSQRGVSRVLNKLDVSIDAGNYYEAHQMYRTLYFRYTAQRKFDDCLDLLYNGALKLISKQQEASAADLGILLVDTLEKRGTESNDGDLWIERLVTIINRLSPTTVERETIINRTIKWSGSVCGSNLGHPTFHKHLAHIFWAEDNTDQARHHYLLCGDGGLCGRILVKICGTKCYMGEIDLFITQAVLQQLCLKERRVAEDTFTAYTSSHPMINRKEAPFEQPLLNFVYYLFRCMETGRLDTFRGLCELYKSSLKRDSSFEKYLAKVGVIFFGIPPPSTASGDGLMGGMFGEMFTRLFQGFDDDDQQQQDDMQASGRSGNSNELD